MRFRPWVPVNGDLDCHPFVVHFRQWGVGAVVGLWSLPLPGVPVGVLATQPLPGVPVDVVLAQPLTGVPGVRLRHLCRPVRLLLPGHQGLGVATVLRGVEVQVGRPLLLPRGLPGRPVLWEGGGCMGSDRFRGRRCGICEGSGVVG